MVQALPVLRCLKLHFPAAEIHWWIETSLLPLLEGDPDLAGVVPFDRRRWAKPENWATLWKQIRWMRSREFDWVIDLQGLIRSGALSWIANGRLLAGLDEPREGARGFYDLIARRRTYHTHAVDWYLSVLPLLGVPVRKDINWMPGRTEVAADLNRKFGLLREQWIALQPGGRWINKRWPVESYAAAARKLAEENPALRFSILGSREDALLGETIAKAVPGRCLDLTGALSLPQMVEWIRACRLMITNDTGPMHVAAALGIPVTGVFGPTEPARTGPYGQVEHAIRASLPCVPCMRDSCRHRPEMECLTSITPDRVVRSAMARL